MASLPQEERDKITAFRSDFAEAEVGIGAFSIDRVLERDPERETEGNARETQSEDSGSERLHVRQYAVETCYGYWVSEKFVDEVDALLESASQSKSATLKRLREWLVRREGFIVEAYQTYLATAKETMDSRGVAWSGYADPELFTDTEPVRKHIRSLVDKLSDEKRFKRYCQACVLRSSRAVGGCDGTGSVRVQLLRVVGGFLVWPEEAQGSGRRTRCDQGVRRGGGGHTRKARGSSGRTRLVRE